LLGDYFSTLLMLVTNNTGEFRRVTGLMHEDWTID
jgi:hypothetical protein